jgi:hypothetical protein
MLSIRNVLILCFSFIVFSCGKGIKQESITKSINCIPNSLSNNVIAFYPFSKGSLKDLSGNNNDLSNTTTAKATSDRDGNINCAYEFDNSPTSTEFLTTGNTAFLNGLSEFSISFWYEPLDTARSVGDYETLICRDLGNSCPDKNGQWSISLYDCRKAVFGRTNSVWDKDIANFDCLQEVIVRTNNWAHLVATFKQDGVEMSIYRNGALQQSSLRDADCGSGTKKVYDIGDLFLGKGYIGKIDDLIIFNKKLSQQEVTALFNMGTCCGE